MDKQTILISAIVALVVSLGVGTLISLQSVDKLGGTVENFPTIFTNGIQVGDPPTTFVDSARAISVTGITNSGNNSTTGNSTVTGDLTVSGDARAASASLTGKFQVGGATASNSSIFVAEIQSVTATTSVLFGNTAAKGTCLKLKDTAGVWRYLRLVGNTVTVNTTACY